MCVLPGVDIVSLHKERTYESSRANVLCIMSCSLVRRHLERLDLKHLAYAIDDASTEDQFAFRWICSHWGSSESIALFFDNRSAPLNHMLIRHVRNTDSQGCLLCMPSQCAPGKQLEPSLGRSAAWRIRQAMPGCLIACVYKHLAQPVLKQCLWLALTKAVNFRSRLSALCLCDPVFLLVVGD